jgi:hypothetical protein
MAAQVLRAWPMITKMTAKQMMIILAAVIVSLATGVAFGTLLGMKRHREPPAWLSMSKNTEGKINGLMIKGQEIPPAVLTALPQVCEDSKLTREQVRELMDRYHLFDHRVTNDKLRCKEGNVTYWFEQNRPRWELEVVFLSRQLLLEEADRAMVVIDTQSELSRWSKRLYQVLIRYVNNQGT